MLVWVEFFFENTFRMDVILNSSSKANLDSFASQPINNVVFYDKSVKDVEILLTFVKEGYKLVSISKNDDFTRSLENNLNPYVPNNVFILSHGKPGQLNIGNQPFNINTLENLSQNPKQKWINHPHGSHAKCYP